MIVSTEGLDQRSAAAELAEALDHPQLVFFSELDGAALLGLLQAPGVLDTLTALGATVAMALPGLDDARARAARLLNERGIAPVAWLLLPPEEGFAFNLQNYPQAIARYRPFQNWAEAHQLHFQAVGLDIEPPLVEVVGDDRLSLREVAKRLWLARDNALYPSAQAAYVELIAAIRHDGYQVHTYQMPVIADDRRSGTTLIQRALDIVDLPSDVDVLMCSSCVRFERVGSDLGGALIASYGPTADAIGVGSTSDDTGSDAPPQLLWPALRRDLLLAAQHTDTIYVFSLEDCAARGLLPQVAALDWSMPAQVAPRRQALISALRVLLVVILLAARFGVTTLAWFGWILALALWLRGRRRG
jgi:hypothetical protein